MKAHVNAVGVIDLITGLFFGFVGVVVSARILFFGPWINGAALWQQEEGVVALAIWLIVSGIFLALGIPSLIAGVGLLKQKRWARTLAIVLAILALASFPIGTAAGLYTLWVLTHDETEQVLSTTV
jgi:protein-S-isoprenylcysteine O-methyltransferase Ste14